MTLYDILGVTKSATKDEIKKAYKTKAQRVHPDKGGDVEKFQELQHAYEILTDEDRRKAYDRDGTTGPCPKTTREKATIEFVHLFSQVLENVDVIYVDIVQTMRSAITARLKEVQQANVQIGVVIHRNQQVLKRTRSKSKDNIFAAMANLNIEKEKVKASQLKEARTVFKEMLAILDDYEYRADAKPERSTNGNRPWFHFQTEGFTDGFTTR